MRSHAHSASTPDGSSVLLVSIVSDHIQVRGPELKLPLPVDNGGQRSSDEKWTIAVTLYASMRVCIHGRLGGDRDRKYLLNFELK